LSNQLSLNVSTAGDLCPLGNFILSLSFDQKRRADWIKNREKVIAGSGLSPSDQAVLLTDSPTKVKNAIIAESGGPGPRIWICVWIR
jgi:hypothetical protein